MMRLSVVLSSLVVVVVALGACSAIKRDAACVAAEKCDQALQAEDSSATGSGFANAAGQSQFAATDPVFGDDLNGNAAQAGFFGNVGTCWQNADTAKPCIDQCKAFVADQQSIAQGNGDQAVFAACGGKGDVNGAAAAGEGEGEGGQ